MTAHTAIALQLEGVHKSFGAHAVLSDINLQLPVGEIVCIMGPSGCGKTTLLNLAAGLLEPDRGMIARPERVGYVFQDPRLLPWKTVGDNVAFGLRAAGVEKGLRQRIAGEYLERMGLASVARRYPHQLSGGMRQRVSLARALAIDPELLLLDEPFKSLDVLLRMDLLQLLTDQWEIKPRPILFVTHEVGEAALVGHRVVVLMGNPARICDIFEAERSPALRRPGDPDVQRMEARLYELLMQFECPPARA